MAVVLTTSPGFGRAGDLPARLAGTGWKVLRRPDGASPGDWAPPEVLAAGLPPVSEAEMAAAPRLHGIVKHGVGLDSVDLAAATRRRLPVTSMPGAKALAVAELRAGRPFRALPQRRGGARERRRGRLRPAARS